MILVDANVWAYYLDANAKEHAIVRKTLPGRLGDEPLLMPPVTQMEVVHYLVKRLGADAADAVDAFLTQAAQIAPLTGGVAAEAARFMLAHHREGIGGRDAAIIVTAKRHGATILTHDKALGKVAKALGIEVEDPVARRSTGGP